MSPLETSNPTTVGPEKCNTVVAQEKDFKIAIMHMLKDINEDMNKSTNKIYENKSKQ